MIKMGKIDFTDWLTKCTLVSSDCILHRHTVWMTNHQEGKDLIYWCLGKKLSSGPPDSAVLSRHSGSKTGPGLKGGPIRRGPVRRGPVRRGPVGRSAVRTGPSLRGPQLEAPHLLIHGEEVVLGASWLGNFVTSLRLQNSAWGIGGPC